MSELVGKLYKVLGGWGAVNGLIEEIRKGKMGFEQSSISTVVAVLDNGIFNPYTGETTCIRVELYPHDRCGSIHIKGFENSEKIDIKESSQAYQTVMKHYRTYADDQELSAKNFFCVFDEYTETYID